MQVVRKSVPLEPNLHLHSDESLANIHVHLKNLLMGDRQKVYKCTMTTSYKGYRGKSWVNHLDELTAEAERILSDRKA